MSLSDVAGGDFLSDDSMDTEEFEQQFTRVTSPELDADHTPATMEQLCALERELREKRRRVLQLRHEYEQAVQDEQSLASAIEDDLAFHGASECLELTEMMCDILPVELREMIYRFLCIEEQLIPVGPYFHFRPYSEYRPLDGLASALSSGRDQIDHTEKPDPTILMPDSHIFNYKYVGLAVAAEMQAAYFANNTFSICDVEDGIAEFFQGVISLDAGGAIGILNMPGDTSAMSHMRMSVRAFKLVRKLQIRLKLEHFGQAADARDLPPGPIGIRERYAEERNFLRQSKNALHKLQSLPRGRQPLQLEFIIMTDLSDILRVEDRERCFINILEAYRNMFYAIKYDHENAIITVVHHDESVSPFPRTLSALWSLTKEQWEHEKALNHGKSTWTADFYLAPALLDASEGYGGFPASEQAALLRERWGIENVLRDREPKLPIIEGRYWPVGNGPPGWM
ncbi:hypothetical protein HBH56_126940 [Parastagonospora nodorum]|uniref:Uncharacterized protein n=1 Tax=Phaeosphaeria nodorum (strain SN15 / ATCC MYA-4574 / FGSC 10173) TaxID=321614 RepID=A0A7U2I9L5_PHANO|nr:hypothetical protein HBH56_126940 [Parastagonospora nodorum]QRD05785.1 hypothetical protein JI435_060570 [Parastagonospora nodorum SN15]KAH3931168.1 hypothetical protein HBH54_096560 [Parastagonospora nodorum]KAH3996515.1 hypothetical protein HBI10_155020 [Parastagonospora nodorum]KAH4019147.1 hypothetical protein HBI13_131050 [Parastagonospora nodorum]